MRDVASKADTVCSTAGLLKIMDDITSLSAAKPPPIAAGGYRVLSVRSDRPRPSRAVVIAPLTSSPMRMRGFLTAMFAGGLGLAVLAGPATCPSCDRAHTDGQLDAKRILSRLTYTPGAVDVAAREMPPLGQTEATVQADRGKPPPLTELALAESGGTASPISTSALSPSPDRVPDAAPAATEPAAAAEPEPRAAKLPEQIEELPDQGAPKTEIAAATVESEPEAPLPPVGATALPLKDITAEDSYDPMPPARPAHKHVTVKQRAAKVRKAAPRNAAPKLYAPNRYAQIPGWAAKMYESPWQNKAFSFQ
jgi:hypothetical protein